MYNICGIYPQINSYGHKMLVQLDFFETTFESEMSTLKREYVEMRAALDRQRKALFARNGDLCKRQLELEGRMEVIERGLCQDDSKD